MRFGRVQALHSIVPAHRYRGDAFGARGGQRLGGSLYLRLRSFQIGALLFGPRHGVIHAGDLRRAEREIVGKLIIGVGGSPVSRARLIFCLARSLRRVMICCWPVRVRTWL